MNRIGRTGWLAILALVAVGLTGCGTGTGSSESPTPTHPAENPEAHPPEGAPALGDGIYTEAQADRGQALYRQDCSRCHASQEFSGPLFETVWEGRTVHDLFHRLSTTMPLDSPGSLGLEQYAALVAYLLRLNDYPAGDRELGFAEEELSGIVIQGNRNE